jgi:hypothetical protein
MKILVIAISFLALAGCYSDTAKREDRHDSPGEATGKAAYNIQKEAKKAAHEAAKDLKTFGHDAREGFQNAKQKDVDRKEQSR